MSDALKVSGSVRLRYEALDGQVRPGFRDGEDLVSLRSTLFVEYDTGPIRIGAELYDSRVYDADPGSVVSTSEVNALEPVQAYLAADLPGLLGKESRTTLQFGRLMLNLGSRRLVAADDYRNTTNSYTGFRADLRLAGDTSATIIYVLPQTRLPDAQPDLLDNKVKLDRESFDIRLWGGLVSKSRVLGAMTAEIGYFGFAERDAPRRMTRNRHLHSVSARLMREPDGGTVDFELEGIYQFGATRLSTAPAAVRLPVSAWFVHADVGYSFAGGWRPRVSVEFDRASGDRSGGRFGRFDTLYGMRRADLAPSGIYAALGRTNIATLGARVEVWPDGRSDAFAVYRLLWAAEETDSFSTTGVRDPSGRAGRFAGHQVEGRVRHWIVPDRLRAEGNAVWLLKRGLLHTAPNAPRTGDTLYGSIAVTAFF